MRLLFITRTYPPLVGGMERFASDFYEAYRQVASIDLLANAGGKRTMLPFLLRTVAHLIGSARKYDRIHLYDAVLSPLLPVIRLCSKARVSFTVNGLDVVYANPLYQFFIRFFLSRADRVVAISRHTMLQCAARGIPERKLSAIPIGIDPDSASSCSEAVRSGFLAKYHIDLSGKKVLLTVGRLVKRKGHAWFIANVLTRLPPQYIYLVAGAGPEHAALARLVDELELGHRVQLLGSVTEEEKACLYDLADLFIMPNIPVPGDQEGFGIVLLEAGLRGLPVIASGIEGITDAVIDGVTGCLVPAQDASAFLRSIQHPGLDRGAIHAAVTSQFGWKAIIDRYRQEFIQMGGLATGGQGD